MAAKKTPKKAAKKATKKVAKKAAKKAAKKVAKKATKAAPRKAAAKAAPRKAAAKAAPKKAAAKAAPKKAAPKKAAPKKAAAKAAPRKAAAKAEAPVTAAVEAAPPKKPVVRDPSLDLAQAIAALALDKKAEDVVILKVTDLTSYADGFVLASAPSERQVQAIARFVDDEMRKAGKAPVGTEGLDQGHWVLVDLGAVVLHVFLSNARRYYDLEGFWSEAPRVDVDEAYGKSILDGMRANAGADRAAATV